MMWFHRRPKITVELSEYLPKAKAYIAGALEKEKRRREREAKEAEERRLAEEARKAAERAREAAAGKTDQLLRESGDGRANDRPVTHSPVKFSVAQDISEDTYDLMRDIEDRRLGIDWRKASELIGSRRKAIASRHTFSTEVTDTLGKLGKKPSEFYRSVGMDKKIFSRIKTDPEYRPSRETAVRCCLGLCLNPENADKLMRLAGYSFSPSSTWDLTVRFCLENGIYNVMDVNLLLDALNEKPLP